MNLREDWDRIRIHFRRSFRSSLHVSIASVGAEGQPCVTPIGTLFLEQKPGGFYFEKYPKTLPRHSEENTNICILGVDSSWWFWLRSLYRGAFLHYPGIKLYGKLGALRPAKTEEIAKLQRRMRRTRGMKGHTYLWIDMPMVREIQFEKATPIRFGEMTKHL